jgi:hypothetical protein
VVVPPAPSVLDALLHDGAEIVTGLTGPFSDVKRSHEHLDPPPEEAS